MKFVEVPKEGDRDLQQEQHLNKKMLKYLDDNEPLFKGVLYTSNINTDPVSRQDYYKIFSKYISPGDVILAIGIGVPDIYRTRNHQIGELSHVTEEKGAQLILSDLGFLNLAMHKEYQELQGRKGVAIVAADATKLPFGDASLNGIASSNLINCPPRNTW